MSQPEIPSPSGEPAARPEQLPPPPGDAAAAGDRPQQAVDGEEQALESHEVIELQSFSVKKAWIEENTKVCMKSVLEACTTAFLNARVVPGAAASHRGLCRHGGRTRVRHRGSRPSHTRTAARMGD